MQKRLVTVAMSAVLSLPTFVAAKDLPKPAVPMPPPSSVNGGPCKLGFDTETTSAYPNTATISVATIAVVKTCGGPAVATFSSEIFTPTAGDVVSLSYIRAYCVNAGGQTSACTPGAYYYANPGDTFIRHTSGESTQAHSMTMVFQSLPRGRYTFDALVYSNSSTAGVGYRTFTVEMYGS